MPFYSLGYMSQVASGGHQPSHWYFANLTNSLMWGPEVMVLFKVLGSQNHPGGAWGPTGLHLTMLGSIQCWELNLVHPRNDPGCVMCSVLAQFLIKPLLGTVQDSIVGDRGVLPAPPALPSGERCHSGSSFCPVGRGERTWDPSQVVWHLGVQ